MKKVAAYIDDTGSLIGSTGLVIMPGPLDGFGLEELDPAARENKKNAPADLMIKLVEEGVSANDLVNLRNAGLI